MYPERIRLPNERATDGVVGEKVGEMNTVQPVPSPQPTPGGGTVVALLSGVPRGIP
jgi:hypothetical protein